MNKGTVYIITLLLAIATFASCKRKHECYCIFSGSSNSTLVREYRGYSAAEARQLCKSEEYSANNSLLVECEIR